MPTLDATTMAGIQVIPWKIALLKYKVQDLINDGKLTFEDLDILVEIEDSSRTKVEMMRQKKETLKEANFGKATMPKEKVPIAKVGSSSTVEREKE